MVGPGRSIEDYIRIMDANEDGAVTPDEVEMLRLKRFRLADTNGDGGIDMKEYSDEYRLRLKERIQEFMKDEDHMTAVRFDSMADTSGYIPRARYDQSGDRAYQAYAQGKLSDKQVSGRGLGMSTTHTKAGILTHDRAGPRQPAGGRGPDPGRVRPLPEVPDAGDGAGRRLHEPDDGGRGDQDAHDRGSQIQRGVGIQENYTFEVKLDFIKDELEVEISKLLF